VRYKSVYNSIADRHWLIIVMLAERCVLTDYVNVMHCQVMVVIMSVRLWLWYCQWKNMSAMVHTYHFLFHFWELCKVQEQNTKYSTACWLLFSCCTQTEDKSDDNSPAALLPTHSDIAAPLHDISFVSASTLATVATVKVCQALVYFVIDVIILFLLNISLHTHDIALFL